MVYWEISHDLKECAIFLLDHPEICTNICEVLGVSLASVKCWWRNVWDCGNVQGNPNQSRVSWKREDRSFDLSVLHNAFTLAWWSQGVDLGDTQHPNLTLSHMAIHQGCWFYIQETENACLRAWWRGSRALDDANNAEFVAEQLISIDETSKDGWTLLKIWICSMKGGSHPNSTIWLRRMLATASCTDYW